KEPILNRISANNFFLSRLIFPSPAGSLCIGQISPNSARRLPIRYKRLLTQSKASEPIIDGFQRIWHTKDSAADHSVSPDKTAVQSFVLFDGYGKCPQWQERIFMSVRSLGYDTDNIDQIVCYFMRTVLHLQTAGVENLPLKSNFAEPWNTFLAASMKVFLASPSPELARLILESEYDAALQQGPLTQETILGLLLIKEFAWHIHYDADYYSYLLSTDSLWGNRALKYAALTFYPNLPENIRKKYGIDALLRPIPKDMFRPDQY
ncbi:MAG: hypothetical protein NC541_15785, partial [bacterium]|nr:hypothetical protein [bacterium]